MTEADWDRSTAPQGMLESLGDRPSERKLRLFAAACCRRTWQWMADERSRQAVEVCERYADAGVGQKGLNAARRLAYAASKAPTPSAPGQGYAGASGHAAVVALNACLSTKRHGRWEVALYTAGAARSLAGHCLGDDADATEAAAQCALLRDLFGPLPFREVRLDPMWLQANDGVVVRLAGAAYEERHLPLGTLDNARLAVLADALEEAGCDNDEMLRHLREQGAVHARGCWVVDLVLEKG